MTDRPDPHFPVLHRVHPRGWLNDPNGILRTADGRWHVFFQHNPDSPRHALIRWGHMSSPDLVTWRQEPLGPEPREGEADRGGCWSGIGLLDTAAGGDGPAVPTLVYSGVDGVDDARSRVIVARLDQTGTALVDPGRVVAEPPALEGLIGVRDPFVFSHGGRRWAVQGAGVRRGDGHLPLLPLYSCDDLDSWELVGTLLDGDDPIAAEHAPADLWECPQLVPVDGRWVLLLSLWSPGRDDDRPVNSVVHLVGDLVDAPDGTPRFVPTAGGRTDLGPDFYAPQAVHDTDSETAADRVLLWGWSWEGAECSQEQTDAQGWAGALTFPRELRLDGEELRAVPAAELAALRAEELPVGAVPEEGEASGDSVLDLPVPVRAEIRATGPGVVEILAADGTAREVLSADDGPATLLLDGSLLEHLPEAATSRTVRFYPEPGETVRVRGALEAAWRLEVPATRP